DYRFLLLYLSGQYNVKNIAKIYGTTEGAIWMRKKRILKRVKCALNIANQLMFSLVFAVPHTYTSKGGDNHEGGETPDTNAHTTPNLNNPLPKLSPKGAEVILSSLEGMPPEDVDLFLVEVCLAALGDEPEDSAEAAQAALAEFNARYEAEQRAVGHHRRVSRKAWVVAAIVGVLLLTTAVAYALGWMPWLFSLTHSTEHHDVGITTGDPGAIADDCGFMPTGLSAEFDGLLEKYGMHIPLPTWLPEGLIYDSTDIISDDEISTDIRAQFAAGRKVVFVGVNKYHLAETAVGIFLEK
ncbi:MAG: hypothetical protein RSD95_17305, partial [Clostridia bacterium]